VRSSTLLSLFVGLALALSLSLTAALIPPRQAVASPPRLPDATAGSGVTVSATEWKAAGYVTKARNTAMSARGYTMYYKKMKSVFGTKNATLVSWRRQMAAAHKQAGGRIKDLSKAESKKVEAMRKKMYGKRKVLNPKSDVVAKVALPDGPNCKGKSGRVTVNRNESHKYYNSCETSDIKYSWIGCVGVMAWVARFTEKKPKVDIPRYFIAGFCGLKAFEIQAVSDKSDIGAVFVRMYQAEAYQPYPGGLRYYISFTLLPQ
jgi:hypothetical protein